MMQQTEASKIRPITWLFEPRHTDAWWAVVLWWELRRIPYTLIVGASGIICFFIGWGLESLPPQWPLPGEHCCLPDPLALAVIVFGFMANVCYTGGWVVELLVRAFSRLKALNFGPLAFKAGLAFSVLVTFGFVILELPIG